MTHGVLAGHNVAVLTSGRMHPREHYCYCPVCEKVEQVEENSVNCELGHGGLMFVASCRIRLPQQEPWPRWHEWGAGGPRRCGRHAGGVDGMQGWQVVGAGPYGAQAA